MRKILLVLAAALAVACRDAGPRGPDGRYDLKTVNGGRLPYDYAYGWEVLTFTGGNVTLHRDGTFVDVVAYRYGASAEADTLYGTWSRVGADSIRMAAPFGGPYYLAWKEPWLSWRGGSSLEFRYRRVR